MRRIEDTAHFHAQKYARLLFLDTPPSAIKPLLSSILFLATVMLALSGCGTGTHTAAITSYSSVPITVKTPLSSFNRMTVSVNVCVPNTSQCVTIDNVMIDTGSTGLRLQEAALIAAHAPLLPVKYYTPGKALAECLRFASGNAWGLERTADVTIGNAHASSLPIQVISTGSALQPSTCPSVTGAATANGTLGIGVLNTDCWSTCKYPVDIGHGVLHWQFYSCGAKLCDPISEAVSTANQLPNPVTQLDGGKYNGIVIDLPSIPGGQADQVSGTLTFGANLDSDSRMIDPDIVPLNADTTLTTTYNGTVWDGKTIFDSGTPALQIPTDEFATCSPSSTRFCVDPAVSRTATISGTDGVPHTVNFMVGMYPTSGVSSVAASYGNKTNPGVTWGAPFFFGRRVAVVLSGQAMPGTSLTGPLYAWQETTIH